MNSFFSGVSKSLTFHCSLMHSKPPSQARGVWLGKLILPCVFLTELLASWGALDRSGNAVCCRFTKPGLRKQWSCICAESTQKPKNRLQQFGWDICRTVSKHFLNLFSVQKCVFSRSHKGFVSYWRHLYIHTCESRSALFF